MKRSGEQVPDMQATTPVLEDLRAKDLGVFRHYAPNPATEMPIVAGCVHGESRGGALPIVVDHLADKREGPSIATKWSQPTPRPAYRLAVDLISFDKPSRSASQGERLEPCAPDLLASLGHSC